MNWGAIGAVGEIIGGVAVLATLVYLAIQVELSNENAKADVEAMHGHWMSENNRAMILSGDMIEVIEKGMSDVATLSDVDRHRFTWWVASMFYFFDNLYKQNRRGSLKEESWATVEKTMTMLLSNKAVDVWWESGFF